MEINIMAVPGIDDNVPVPMIAVAQVRDVVE